jgi:hypothetical protein
METEGLTVCKARALIILAPDEGVARLNKSLPKEYAKRIFLDALKGKSENSKLNKLLGIKILREFGK